MGAIFSTLTSPTARTGPSIELPDTEHCEEYVKGDNTKAQLFTQQWVPEKPPKALIFLGHPYAEDSNWLYGKFVGGFFSSLGCAVFGIDYIGHGRSKGIHGHVPDFQALFRDVESHFSQIRQKYPGIKAFFVGESIGGACALTIASRSPNFVDGLILCAPATGINADLLPPKPVIMLLRALSHVAPTLPLIATDDMLALGVRDPEVREYGRKNPLRYAGRVRISTGLGLLDAAQHVMDIIPKVTTPMLILHGTADKAVLLEGSQSLYERASSSDKTLRVYEGGYHYLFTEPEPARSQLHADVKQWLEERW